MSSGTDIKCKIPVLDLANTKKEWQRVVSNPPLANCLAGADGEKVKIYSIATEEHSKSLLMMVLVNSHLLDPEVIGDRKIGIHVDLKNARQIDVYMPGETEGSVCLFGFTFPVDVIPVQ
tara:strand:- start:132 stop:488 length:357 start_codon:yes stop_codon:yes gene_type:complete